MKQNLMGMLVLALFVFLVSIVMPDEIKQATCLIVYVGMFDCLSLEKMTFTCI